MRRFRGFVQTSDQSAEVNMSPLIDIVFILLIFFVVTTVFIEDPGVEIKKPQASTAEELAKEAVLFAVTEEGEVYYGGRNVGVEAVSGIVAAMLGENPDLPVVIQGDVDTKYGIVMRVTDAAQLGGAKSVYSATAK